MKPACSCGDYCAGCGVPYYAEHKEICPFSPKKQEKKIIMKSFLREKFQNLIFRIKHNQEYDLIDGVRFTEDEEKKKVIKTIKEFYNSITGEEL